MLLRLEREETTAQATALLGSFPEAGGCPVPDAEFCAGPDPHLGTQENYPPGCSVPDARAHGIPPHAGSSPSSFAGGRPHPQFTTTGHRDLL